MRKKVIKSLINIGSYQEQFNQIISLSQNKQSSYVCIANVHMVIESYLDKSFQDIVNSADMVTPDGMPLAKAIKLLYKIPQDRVAGMDLLPDLIDFCGQNNKKIFLYGSTNDILEKIESKAKNSYPNIDILSYSPPFRRLLQEEEDAIIKSINLFNPDFVFVALGCPKQEKWMAEHKDKINSCMVGLGGAFEVYAQAKSRAPKWMQDYSLEWLYRLMQDPKRLWKRYLITNTLYIYLLIIELIKIKVFRQNVK